MAGGNALFGQFGPNLGFVVVHQQWRNTLQSANLGFGGRLLIPVRCLAGDVLTCKEVDTSQRVFLRRAFSRLNKMDCYSNTLYNKYELPKARVRYNKYHWCHNVLMGGEFLKYSPGCSLGGPNTHIMSKRAEKGHN